MAIRTFFFSLLLLTCVFAPAQAQEDAFRSWLHQFAQQAVAEGVAPATLERVLPHIRFDDSVIDLDRKQPESKITFAAYLRNVMPESRVHKGRALKEEYAATLSQVSKQTGVPPSVIVALWGMESSFGANTGDYEVLDSLASLAYEGRRSSFFRKELIQALKILDEERIDPATLLGSWAGAMGQCQFMPTTFRHYAVDFDGDGRRDIWGNEGDILASIAHYLHAEGWTAGQPWGEEVKVSRSIPADQKGLEIRHNLSVWAKKGVHGLGGRQLKENGLEASLIQPDGSGGRSFLVYDNFRALMRWNRSTYFATSVGLLANQIDDGK